MTTDPHDAPIPEDLHKLYEMVKTSHSSMGWRWTIVANPLFERIAAAEKRAADAEAQVKAVSSTYGELVHSAPNTAKMIEPHEWDNKTPSEQRDWAVAQIEALSPPISREEIERSYRGGGWIGFANRFNAILAARLSSAKGGDDGK